MNNEFLTEIACPNCLAPIDVRQHGQHVTCDACSSQFLLVCTGLQNPAQQFETILRDEFGEVYRDGIHWIWYEGECQVVVTPTMREVPPGDFAVLQQYLAQKQYLTVL